MAILSFIIGQELSPCCYIQMRGLRVIFEVITLSLALVLQELVSLSIQVSESRFADMTALSLQPTENFEVEAHFFADRKIVTLEGLVVFTPPLFC